MMRKRIYFSTIDKDVMRVLGKRLYKECEDKNGGWIVAQRSNGDAEYHLNSKAYSKLREYIFAHKRSRLFKAYVASDGYNIRFEIDSWQ